MRRTERWELVVVWTGALERAQVRTQQRPAPRIWPAHPTRAQHRAYTPAILQLLEDAPERWWSYAALMAASGLPEGVCKEAVRRLKAAGWLEQARVPQARRGGSRRVVRYRAEPV